jgi:hypothetical protein
LASYGSYDFRTPNLEDYIYFEHALDVIQRKGGTKQDLKIIELTCTMAAGATMIAADAGRTAEFDGTGTPIIVYAISSDNTQDKSGGTGALEVTVFGTDENDLYVEEAFTLNGTTQVAGTTKFKRLIAAMLTSCGSGGVGVGNVTITSTGQAATYLTIPAGQAGTAQAGKCYIPSGYKSLILARNVNLVQTADAASVLLTEGANVWIRKYVDGNTVTEDELHQYSITNLEVEYITPHWGILAGGDDSYWDIFHQSIDTDIITNIFHYDIFYLVWKEA